MSTSDRSTSPVRLPGVGTSLALRDLSGRPLTVVRRQNGDVELYLDGAAT